MIKLEVSTVLDIFGRAAAKPGQKSGRRDRKFLTPLPLSNILNCVGDFGLEILSVKFYRNEESEPSDSSFL